MNKEALINRFEAYMTGNKLAEATVYTYSQTITEFLTVIGKPPQKTTKQDIEDFKYHLSQRLGESSIVTSLAAVGNFLESHDNYECRKVKRPRIPKKLPVVLTEEEVNRLLKAASRDPLANAVIKVLYYTGMRSGSLRRLEWTDILWEEGKVNLRRTKRGKYYTALMPPQAQEALLAYKPFREDPIFSRDNEVVFISPRSEKPLGQPGVNHLVKKYAAKAGIAKRTYAHLLRHTHGTIARLRGIPLDAIARQLGHDDISSTMTYVQLADSLFEQEYQDFFSTESHGKPAFPERLRKPQPDFDLAYR